MLIYFILLTDSLKIIYSFLPDAECKTTLIKIKTVEQFKCYKGIEKQLYQKRNKYLALEYN